MQYFIITQFFDELHKRVIVRLFHFLTVEIGLYNIDHLVTYSFLVPLIGMVCLLIFNKIPIGTLIWMVRLFGRLESYLTKSMLCIEIMIEDA